MKEKIENLKAYMLESSDFDNLLFFTEEGKVEGRFFGFYFEIIGLTKSKPILKTDSCRGINIKLAEILLHFGIVETNRFKNTKVTHSSLDLLAKIVRKSFDEKQNTKERGQEIVDLAFQLGLPNAEHIKSNHESKIYVPWV